MEITLLHFEGCPNVGLARERVLEAAGHLGVQVHLRLEELGTASAADRATFKGSPTILLGGADAFPGGETLSEPGCRLYRTEIGLEGAPSVAQLEEVLV